jgi:hypothetical protein
MPLKAGGDIAVRLRLKRDVIAQPGGNDRWRDPPRLLFSGSAQSRMILSYGGETE